MFGTQVMYFTKVFCRYLLLDTRACQLSKSVELEARLQLP